MTIQKIAYTRKALYGSLALTLLLVTAYLLTVPAGAGATETATPSTEIVERQIAIHDDSLGDISFDAIAAGDPALAARGRLVLLLHGFPESRESFEEILPVLAGKGYYAVAPNLRGYSKGVRPTDRAEYTVEKSAHDAVAMAFALGAQQFHLVGHDWGGAVVWGVGSQLPGVVKSLSVLSTPHPDALKKAYDDWLSPQRWMLWYLGVVRIPDLEKLMFAAGPEGFALGLNAMGLPYQKARTYAHTLGNTAGLRAALSWYHANPVPAGYLIGRAQAPTLFMWGEKDFAFSRDAAEATAEFVDAPYRFVPLPGIGHWVPERATEQVISEVTAHIEANS